MPDKPATDPAKPGSKLAQIQTLGRRVLFGTLPDKPECARPAPEPLNHGQPTSTSRGRPKGEQPWVALGISKQAYYKRKRMSFLND